MNMRYHIEELVSQDARGVVFQGGDAVTGVVVAIRRFISTHIDGTCGGENGGKGYENAIVELKKVSHPSLRRVLAGGCDPVDGMPYLVTRWVDGILLREVVAIEGPLDRELVVSLLAQLLNLNMTLSKALGREGLWAEAALDSVVVKPPQDENEVATAIFWVSPWRWFGGGTVAGGAMELADFAEAMLGGPRQVAREHAGTEVVEWIQKIRNKQLTGLREIQEALHAPGTPVSPFVLKENTDEATTTKDHDAPAVAPKPTDPSPPTKPATPTRPATPTKPRKPAAPAPLVPLAASPKSRSATNTRKKKPVTRIAMVVVLLALIGGAGWLMVERTQIRADHVGGMADSGAAPPSVEDDAPPASPQRSRHQAAKPDAMMIEVGSGNSAASERLLRAEKRGYFTIDEGDLMLDRIGQSVALRGRLSRVRFSSSGLTMYLEFSESTQIEEPRAYAMARDLADGIHPEDFEPLIGKRIEIHGEVEVENVSRTRRPRIELNDRGQITVVEEEMEYELR